MLIPLQDETSNTIVEALLDHYIYTFGAPKNILTEEETNSSSELVTQFEEALNIKHIKTTSFHPQSNGNIERMHSALLNLIKTSIAENNRKWDDNMKVINFTSNTTPNQTTIFTPSSSRLEEIPIFHRQ